MIRILPRCASDYASVLLSTDGAMSAGPKPFRFESCWIRVESSRAVVEGAWWANVQGSASFRLVQRIKATKVALRKWNKDVFGVAQTQIKIISDCLHAIQAPPPSDLNWDAEQRLQVDLLEALKRAESIWKQKSRIS